MHTGICGGVHLKKSVFYEKCFRCACVSAVLSAVGCGIYAVLSDNGFIPKAEDVLSDTRAGNILTRIRKLF